MKLNKKQCILYSKKIVICILGLFLLGLSAAINIRTNLGSDPITVFYDGLTEFFHIDISIMISIINLTLSMLVLFLGREYLNLGTIIYLFLLGIFVDFGMTFYEFLSPPDFLFCRLIISLIGCLLAFVGMSLFIVANVGIDPWTALAMIISKKINKSFRAVKIVLDVLTLILGILAGGTFGVITIFCAFVGGPAIQKISEFLDNKLESMLKSQNES